MGWLSPAWAWMCLLRVVQQALPMRLRVRQVTKDNDMTPGLGGLASLSGSPTITHFDWVSFRGEPPYPLLLHWF